MSNMTKCFVKTCKSSDRSHAHGVTFHKIPEYAKTTWLAAIDRPADTMLINQRICSLHFRENAFDKVGERTRIQKNAVPTENLPPKQDACPAVAVKSKNLPPCSSLVRAIDASDFSTVNIVEPNITISNQRVAFQYVTNEAVGTKKHPCKCEWSTITSDTSSIKRTNKVIQWMHSYSRSPNHYEKLIRNAENQRRAYCTKLKAVEKTCRRRKMKIRHLTDVITLLKKQSLVSTTALKHVEESIVGIPLAVINEVHG